MSEDLIFQRIITYPPTEEQMVRARQVVCSYAEDAEEATTLLSMIGLL